MPAFMETALILAALWVAVLAPRLLRRLSRFQGERKYASSSPLLSGSSRYQNVVPLTGVVQLTPPPRAALVTPGIGVDRDGLSRLQREQARLRRRNILLGLLALAAITLAAAMAAGGAMIGVHLFVDVLLVAYVGALAARQRRVLERHAKVTDIALARLAAHSSNSRPQSAGDEAAISFITLSGSRS
ncbi:MAG: hypothetical protein OXH20_04545 [bacterium]|nr:hypothetical protein [bacterium]MDE0667599.1 hypothetical protein [bacterium]